MMKVLADKLALGELLEVLRRMAGGYALLAFWSQGEFHHDLVLRVERPARVGLKAPILVVSTNCNGGVKELLAFDEVPTRDALWHHRVPSSDEFRPEALPPIREQHRTVHHFDPSELLGPDARSEIRPEFRARQRGGGWRLTS
jgi:hypothetical protein